MEIFEGAQVKSADDKDLGSVDRVVIDPRTLRVTHLVVQKGVFFTTDKVIPIDWVDYSEQSQVRLKRGRSNLDECPDFEETHYVSAEGDERKNEPLPMEYFARSYYWYPPVGFPMGAGFPGAYAAIPAADIETERNIPTGTVALKEGASVMDKNGDAVGSVERIVVDANTKKATHFVLASGRLIRERKLIPIHWVTTLAEDKLQLEVGSRFLDRLPVYEE